MRALDSRQSAGTCSLRVGCPQSPHRGFSRKQKETQMNIKRLILAGCSVVVLSAGTAMAGPCDTTGRTSNLKDAGSGPASQSTTQTAGVASESKEHPPT